MYTMINSRLQGTLVLCGILLNCDFGLGTPLATLRSLGSPETVTGEEFYVESGGVYAVCSLDYTTDLVTLDPSVSVFFFIETAISFNLRRHKSCTNLNLIPYLHPENHEISILHYQL